jgi:hypothetical protein
VNTRYNGFGGMESRSTNDSHDVPHLRCTSRIQLSSTVVADDETKLVTQQK